MVKEIKRWRAEGSSLIFRQDSQIKSLILFQQHLCVTCAPALCSTSHGRAQDHAGLMDSVPLQPLPMDLPP